VALEIMKQKTQYLRRTILPRTQNTCPLKPAVCSTWYCRIVFCVADIRPIAAHRASTCVLRSSLVAIQAAEDLQDTAEEETMTQEKEG
jgi:hypothetical protein